jgi:O-antigen/teichoic acid export membrane protein
MSAEEIEQPSHAADPPPKLMTAAMVYGIANLIIAAIPLLLLPIFVRVLNPADFGQIAMFSVVQAMLLPVLGLSSKSAILREYYDKTRDVPSLVATALMILLATIVGIVALFLLAGHWLSPVLHLSLSWIMLAVLATSAQFIISVRLALWQAARTPLPYVSFQILLAIFNAAISLCLVLATDLGWQGRVLGLTVALAAFSIIAFWHLRSRAEIKWTPSWHDARDIMRYSAPVAFTGLATAIFAITDRLFVANLLGIEQAGTYAIALQLALVIGLATQAFDRAYSPWLFEKLGETDHASEAHLVRQTYLYFLLLLAAALIVGAASPLSVFVVGPRYGESLTLVPYLAVGTAIGGMCNVVANYIFYARRTMLLLLVTAASAITNVVAMTSLIHLNGTAGAAQAFVVSQAVLFGATWWIASVVHPMPWWRSVKF